MMMLSLGGLYISFLLAKIEDNSEHNSTTSASVFCWEMNKSTINLFLRGKTDLVLY